MNILIVDDHPTNLRLLEAQLRAEGHRVTPTANGVEALGALDRGGVDVIVSDILMPQMDGYRLCYEVRRKPAWQAIPFIFYTATYTSARDEKLCLDLGGDKYLRKPSSAEEIMSALNEASDAARSRAHRPAGSQPEPDVMQEYNQQLVSKLEEKHIELQTALRTLEAAHAEILELNRTLEQRVAERTADLEAANRDLESFSYSVSHDLRAPLRAVDGLLQLFRQDYAMQLPEHADARLQRIHESAVHMGLLIEGLLALARSSRQTLQKEPISPAEIAKRALEQLRPEREGRNLQISVADLPACEADSTLLQQVFANLLSNALKYSRQRDPAVIEVGSRTENGEAIYFVRDNGAGFAMAHSKKLFGVFERLHHADEFAGIGIGLSIVKRIIERHGGRIWAEAEVGKGATFSFTLPR